MPESRTTRLMDTPSGAPSSAVGFEESATVTAKATRSPATYVLELMASIATASFSDLPAVSTVTIPSVAAWMSTL